MTRPIMESGRSPEANPVSTTRTDDDDATTLISTSKATPPGRPAAQTSRRRVSTQLFTCSVITAALTAGLVALSVVGSTRRDMDSVWLLGIAVSVVVSFGLSLFVAMRDYMDNRVSTMEARILTHIQFETFRLEQGIDKVSDAVRDLHRILGRLPSGVLSYGEEREDHGEARAVHLLTAANGTDGPRARGVAQLRSIRPT